MAATGAPSARVTMLTSPTEGMAAPSTTVLDGRLAIRAAIVNHRTDVVDIDRLVSAVLEFGARRSSCTPGQVRAIDESIAV